MRSQLKQREHLKQKEVCVSWLRFLGVLVVESATKSEVSLFATLVTDYSKSCPGIVRPASEYRPACLDRRV